jgi:hypothetical protein
MKTILVLGALGLVALFRRAAPTRTGWTADGLPQPIASKAELRTQARALASSLRTRTAETVGLVRQFQRGAGLLAEVVETAERSPDEGRDRAAAGVYDATTRQALGWYGQIWIEETP